MEIPEVTYRIYSRVYPVVDSSGSFGMFSVSFRLVFYTTGRGIVHRMCKHVHPVPETSGRFRTDRFPSGVIRYIYREQIETEGEGFWLENTTDYCTLQIKRINIW